MNVVWVRSCARLQSRHSRKRSRTAGFPTCSTKATNSPSSRTVTSVSTPALPACGAGLPQRTGSARAVALRRNGARPARVSVPAGTSANRRAASDHGGVHLRRPPGGVRGDLHCLSGGDRHMRRRVAVAVPGQARGHVDLDDGAAPWSTSIASGSTQLSGILVVITVAPPGQRAADRVKSDGTAASARIQIQ